MSGNSSSFSSTTVASCDVQTSIAPESLVFGDDLVLIDLRSYDMYSKGHIDGAVNLNMPRLLWRGFLKQRSNAGSLEQFLMSPETKYDLLKKPSENTRFVLYDENTTSLENVSEDDPLRVFMQYFGLYGNRVYFIKGGFNTAKETLNHMIVKEQFSYHYQHSSLTLSPQFVPHQEPELNFFLDNGFMAIGSEVDAFNIKLLQKYKVTHVLNCTQHNFHPEVFATCKTLQIPINDSMKQDLFGYMKSALEFIHNARMASSNTKLLIHCQAGISRSVSFAIAYVMWAENLSFDEGLKLVHTHRSVASPNLNFAGQLLILGQFLKTSSLDDAIQSAKEFLFKPNI